MKKDLNQITDYLADNSVIRIPQFDVEKKLFSETSELQLDPTFTQEYILENYLNKTNSIKIYDDTWIKFADTEDIYVSDDVVELDIEKNISESSIKPSFYIQYRDNYLQYFNFIQEYFREALVLLWL